jgi:hypothetical protein|tara:strand:- start:345 stop:539 length:195 start_codon:yes stop_codon:yes gene_type:complete
MNILIQPKDDYRCADYSWPALDRNKVYSATLATTQPDYIEKGLVFCGDYLLGKNEYYLIDIEVA